MEQFVRELVDAWNSHDLERVTHLYASDYEGTDVGQATTYHGLQGVRTTLERYLQSFPDLNFTLEETVAGASQIAFSWTAQGTHRGRLMNIPATGRVVEVRGISMMTIKDGKVASARHVWDVAGLLRAIGLLPELSA